MGNSMSKKNTNSLNLNSFSSNANSDTPLLDVPVSYEPFPKRTSCCDKINQALATCFSNVIDCCSFSVTAFFKKYVYDSNDNNFIQAKDAKNKRSQTLAVSALSTPKSTIQMLWNDWGLPIMLLIAGVCLYYELSSNSELSLSVGDVFPGDERRRIFNLHPGASRLAVNGDSWVLFFNALADFGSSEFVPVLLLLSCVSYLLSASYSRVSAVKAQDQSDRNAVNARAGWSKFFRHADGSLNLPKPTAILAMLALPWTIYDFSSVLIAGLGAPMTVSQLQDLVLQNPPCPGFNVTMPVDCATGAMQHAMSHVAKQLYEHFPSLMSKGAGLLSALILSGIWEKWIAPRIEYLSSNREQTAETFNGLNQSLNNSGVSIEVIGDDDDNDRDYDVNDDNNLASHLFFDNSNVELESKVPEEKTPLPNSYKLL